MPTQSNINEGTIYDYSGQYLLFFNYSLTDHQNDFITSDDLNSTYQISNIRYINIFTDAYNNPYLLILGNNQQQNVFLLLVINFYPRIYLEISDVFSETSQDTQANCYYFGEIIILYSTNESFIQIYNFSNIALAKSIQEINYFYKIFNQSIPVEVHPLSVHVHNSSVFLVLDKIYGLFLYTLNEENYYIESNILNVSIYGVPKDLSDPVYWNNKFFYFVFMQNTVLIIDLLYFTEYGVVNSLDTEGNWAMPIGIELIGDFLVITVLSNSSEISLQIVNMNFLLSSLCHLPVSIKNPMAHWTIVSNTYYRFEQNNISSYEISLFVPQASLIYDPNNQSTASLNIIATDVYNKTVSSVIHIFYSQTPNKIYSDAENFETSQIFNSQTETVYLPNYLFHGWNQSYYLTEPNLTNFNFKLNNPPKIEFFSEISVNMPYFVIPISEIILFVNQSNVVTLNLYTNEMIEYNIPSAESGWRLNTNNNSEVIAIYASGFLISQIYFIENGNLTLPYHLNMSCDILIHCKNLIICQHSAFSFEFFKVFSVSYSQNEVEIILLGSINIKPIEFSSFNLTQCKQTTNSQNEIEYTLYLTGENWIYSIAYAFGSSNFITNYYQFPFNISGSPVFVGNNQVYVLTIEGLYIFDKFLALINILNFQFTQVLFLDDFFYGVIDNYLIAIDGTQELSMDLLYLNTSIGINESLSGLVYDSNKNAIMITIEGSLIRTYKVLCPNLNVNCKFSVNFEITIESIPNLSKNYFSTSLVMTSYNGYFEKNLTLNLILYTYGMSIIQFNPYQNTNEIEYQDHRVYNIKRYVAGYNVEVNLTVNGKDPSQFNFPTVYPQNSLSNITYSTNYTIIALSTIYLSDFILILTSDCQILKITDENFQQYTSSYSLTNIFHQYLDLRCSNIFSIAEQNNQVLVVIIAEYSVIFDSVYNTSFNLTVKKPVLLAFVITISNFSDYQFFSWNLPIFPTKVNFVQGTCSYFQLIMSYSYENPVNNYLARFMGHWVNNSVSFEYVEKINFFTLGLNSFSAVAFQSYFYFNNTAQDYFLDLYVIDSFYGIRYLQSVGANSSILRQSIKLENAANSIAISHSTVFIGYNDTTISKFVIQKNGFLKQVPGYTAYNNPNSLYFATEGFMHINAFYNARFLCMPISGEDLEIFRIFDLYQISDSVIVKDIDSNYLDVNSSSRFGFFFIGPMKFLVSEINGRKIFVFTIQDLTFDIPSLSNQQFEEMDKEYNASFDVAITYFNRRSSLDVNFSFSRVSDLPTSYPLHNIWDGWIYLISIGSCILLIVTGFITYKVCWSKKKKNKIFVSQEQKELLELPFRNKFE